MAVGVQAREIAGQLARLALDGPSDVAAALKRLCSQRLLDLPLPGRGSTGVRYEVLAEISAVDLSLARLAEGHCDALAILAELASPVESATYGVWAADPPQARVEARPATGGYRLNGLKRYASGADSLARALVTAQAPEGPCLFDLALDAPGIQRVAGSWPAIGMANSNSLDVRLEDVFVPSSRRVGRPNAYLERPGFWHGGVGVAACWFGGALGCLRELERRLRGSCDDHAAAHLGAVASACHAMQATLRQAAGAIDADPQDLTHTARERALLVRSVVERGCEEVLTHTHRATGSSALVFEPRHARRAADLPVYVRQHHAERDLASLGRTILERSEGAVCP